jgi:serine/threonine-protein kinase
VLFSVFKSISGVEGASIQVMTFGDRRRKIIRQGAAWGRYVPTGHLLYINDGTVVAVPFDRATLEVRGTPTPVLEGVEYNMTFGSPQFDFSRTGTLVYRGSGEARGLVTIEWLDSSGKTKPLLARRGNYVSPRLLPNGERLALISAGDVWVYDLRREIMMRLTFGGGASNPIWRGDGFILFRAPGGLFWINAEGAGKPQPLTRSKNLQAPWSLTPDGKLLAFVEIDPVNGADLWTVAVEDDREGLRAGEAEPFLQTPFNERAPAFSPDGHWLAYASDESGTLQIYVRAFPDKSGKRQVSSDGGAFPMWSRTRRELFFQNTSQIMVAPYTMHGNSFDADKPRLWSERRLAIVSPSFNYDVAPDGTRVVALLPAQAGQERKPEHHVIFLLNFFDELRRRAPSSK